MGKPARRRVQSVPVAILCDVQGTATEFHSTVRNAAAAIAGTGHPHVDWSDFVNRWRTSYFTLVNNNGRGPGEWVSVDSIYRQALDRLLEQDQIDLSEEERLDLNSAWCRQEPWPDSVDGLRRVRRGGFLLAALSNADVSAVVQISRHCDFPWHAIFTAEMCGAFKPDPATYRLAAGYLGLTPPEILMVASHKYDIRAAATLGFRTAFVSRPHEFGEASPAECAFSEEFDYNVQNFDELAGQLGC